MDVRKEGEGERERRTRCTPYGVALPRYLYTRKICNQRQWRPRERNTTGTSCILAPIKRAEGNLANRERLKYNRSLKYVWAHGEIYANVSAYLCARL